MATLMAPPKTNDYAAEVSGQLTQAAGRIRFHDLTVGALLFALTLLAYTAAMVVLDKQFEFDAWVRQTGWFGLLLVLGFVAYRYLWTPLRQAVNPLYTAKLVEQTVPDAKNSIVNWVDLQDQSMPESVKQAVTAKAAKQLADADVNRAVESRTMLYSGIGVAALVVLLAALFLAFKPTVFGSLVGRALNPFSSGVIATRTSITLVQPTGDATIVAGEPVAVTVLVEGREPDAAAPDRLHVLLRHNPADENPEEVNLEPAGGREWTIRIPQHLVQNGFWYRVAGGDAVTPEYRVTVRPRPVFTDYQITYEYPEYLNVRNENSRDPHLEAYRGTIVTITAKANRELKDGRMVVTDVPQPVVGDVRGDTLTVRFTLMDNGSYRLHYTSSSGESNVDAQLFLMRVITDAAPTIAFKPTQLESVTLPANGLLPVDADIADDFGIEGVVLRMKIENGAMLKAKPYRGGKSFRREDKTWPTALEYKDSVKIDELKLETGQPAGLKPGTVIEYWLEATDNCTVPKANVGKSKVMKVILAPPVTDDESKKVQKDQNDQRRGDEQKHGEKQDQKNAGEERPKKEGPQEQKTGDKPEQKDPNKGGEPNKDPNKGAEPNKDPQKGSEPNKDPNKGGEPNKDPNKGAEPNKDPNKGGEPNKDPSKGGEPQPKENPAKPEDADLKDKAEQIQNQIKEMNRDPGEGKSGDAPKPDEPQPKPGDRKEGPKDAGKPQPKPQEPNAGDPSQEKNEGSKPQPMDPAESKDQNPGDTSTEKSPPKSDPMTGGDKSAETKSAGDPNPKESPGDARSSKDPTGDPNAKPPQGENKPAKQPQPGEDKATPDKDSKNDPGAAPKKDPGQGRNQTPPKAGEQKPTDKTQAATKDGSPKPEEKPGDEKGADSPSGEKTAGAPKPGDPKPEPGKANDKPLDPKDLGSQDAGTKKAAQDKLDKMAQENARKEADKLAKDLKSDDKATRDAAQKKLDDLKKAADEATKNAKPGDAPKPDSKDLDKAANDLKSGDAAKEKAAGEKFDQAMKDAAKKDAEQLAKDLQSPDPKTKAAAEKKLDDLKDQQAQGGSGQKKPDMKEIADAAKDLNSPDDAKRKAAEDKLDKMVGENARKEAQQLAKDLKSDDKATRDAAQKKLDDMMKKAEDMAKGQKPRTPTKEELDAIKDLAKDLKSEDKSKREKAEKELDDKLGKENRDALKEAMKEQPKEEPLPPELQKKIEEMAKRGNPSKQPRPGGPPGSERDPNAEALKADEDFAKRSGQLQLETLRKERANQELLKKLGWTQEDYDRFVKGYEEMLKRQDTAAAENTDPSTKPPVPRINTGSAGSSPQASGTAVAPPGYSDAQKKFLDAAGKDRK